MTDNRALVTDLFSLGERGTVLVGVSAQTIPSRIAEFDFWLEVDGEHREQVSVVGLEMAGKTSERSFGLLVRPAPAVTTNDLSLHVVQITWAHRQ